MNERLSWLIAGLSLIIGGLVAAAATYLWWLPCRGRMLVGTRLGPPYSDSLLGEACIDRMNEGTPFPLPTEAALTAPGLLLLSTLTMILTGMAWLAPVASLPVSSTARLGIALPGFALLALAAVGLGTAYGSESWAADALGFFLEMILHLLVLVSIGALIALRTPGLARFLVVALPVSAFGFFGMVLDYVVMIRWSDADWDSPPGSGYLTAGLLLLCGLAVLIMTAWPRRPRTTGPSVVLEDVVA